MAKLEGKEDKKITSVSLSSKVVESIDEVLELRGLGYENRSTLIEQAIVEFLKQEVIKYGTKISAR